ncbi:hypothetical protein AVEN_275242-1 [Araneus ventricosus]|uniref:Uncharacterized protein n=1 Tax=Araneus ventricosus TaxID=182803 RepID=A0A4Y2JLN9_ARAVE|nr:hypothetical protein AVEN_275242-1 [Araneus ventricosus]
MLKRNGRRKDEKEMEEGEDCGRAILKYGQRRERHSRRHPFSKMSYHSNKRTAILNGFNLNMPPIYGGSLLELDLENVSTGYTDENTTKGLWQPCRETEGIWVGSPNPERRLDDKDGQILLYTRGVDV